jgi:hypothetical protein
MSLAPYRHQRLVLDVSDLTPAGTGATGGLLPDAANDCPHNAVVSTIAPQRWICPGGDRQSAYPLS